MKVVVYTSITNDHDYLQTEQCYEGADFVCFVDDKFKESCFGKWSIARANNRFIDPALNSRIHKILPHNYFCDYDYSLWIDATFTLVYPVQKIIEKYMKNAYVALFKHKDHNCAYIDAQRAIENPKYLHEKLHIERQVLKYQFQGYPENNGQAYSGFILRKHNKRIESFNNMWWADVTAFSKCDQIALNYVLWRFEIPFVYLDSGGRSLRKPNKFLRYTHHKRNKQMLTQEAIERGV